MNNTENDTQFIRHSQAKEHFIDHNSPSSTISEGACFLCCIISIETHSERCFWTFLTRCADTEGVFISDDRRPWSCSLGFLVAKWDLQCVRWFLTCRLVTEAHRVKTNHSAARENWLHTDCVDLRTLRGMRYRVPDSTPPLASIHVHVHTLSF